MSGSTFRFVRTVGAVLTGDALAGAAELRQLCDELLAAAKAADGWR